MTALTFPTASTCQSCGHPIVPEPVWRRGDKERTTQWSDGVSERPILCLASVSLVHVPEGGGVL